MTGGATPAVPDHDASRRRREGARAGHLTGEREAGVATARAALADPEPAVRATALGALARLGDLTAADVEAAATDRAPAVRARAAELAGLAGDIGPGPAGVGVEALVGVLLRVLHDGQAEVVEAAAFGLGELGAAAGGNAVEALAGVAAGHPDPLCREAAVAAIGAIGAIGAPAGLDAVLAAMGDKPAVRRRAVLALAAFEGPDVEAALQAALSDRDWQVRQAAEDLTDRRPTS